jgi:hypothetical protein
VPATPLDRRGQIAGDAHPYRDATVETGSVQVMFTDGLKSKTMLKGQLDIVQQPVISIAQHLENHGRPDGALVLVARFVR